MICKNGSFDTILNIKIRPYNAVTLIKNLYSYIGDEGKITLNQDIDYGGRMEKVMKNALKKIIIIPLAIITMLGVKLTDNKPVCETPYQRPDIRFHRKSAPVLLNSV